MRLSRLVQSGHSPHSTTMADPLLSIYQLKEAAQYRVCRSFNDFYQGAFREGEVLTFVKFHFLPYHGGYTVVFREKTLYLQEEANADILDAFGSFFRQV